MYDAHKYNELRRKVEAGSCERQVAFVVTFALTSWQRCLSERPSLSSASV
jgi:hypothetical protein